jgi:hypothetical protein
VAQPPTNNAANNMQVHAVLIAYASYCFMSVNKPNTYYIYRAGSELSTFFPVF